MVFSKELSLPFGAKRLLMCQVDLLKEESPLPIRGRRAERRNICGTKTGREMQSKVEMCRISCLRVFTTEKFRFIFDFSR